MDLDTLVNLADASGYHIAQPCIYRGKGAKAVRNREVRPLIQGLEIGEGQRCRRYETNVSSSAVIRFCD